MTTGPGHHADPAAFDRHHFDEVLAEIRQGLLEMGGLVTENVKRAGHAMLERRLDLIDPVREADREVNAKYIELERKIFTTLALQQPVASDLRFLIAATRIVYELERSGDLAVNCVNVLERLEGFPDAPRIMGRLEKILDCAGAVFAQGTDAIADMVADAGAVLDEADDTVDRAVGEFYTEIGRESEALGLEVAVALTRVGRFLERIADHAVNVGEQVTYIVTGELLQDEAEPWGLDTS